MAVKVKKIDLWAQKKNVYSPRAGIPELVKVPALTYLAVDGSGDPNTSSGFRDGIGALYGLAYTSKFMLKKEKGVDFRVMPLSGLYHADDPQAFLSGSKREWKWTLMIPVPSVVSEAVLKKARAQVEEKRGPNPALGRVRKVVVREGLAAQILHIGPYAEERPTIEKLHAFIREKGLVAAGAHHEIYLSDPNRAKPEKMKTIVRQPVRKMPR
jgi:hypothetical protein